MEIKIATPYFPPAAAPATLGPSSAPAAIHRHGGDDDEDDNSNGLASTSGLIVDKRRIGNGTGTGTCTATRSRAPPPPPPPPPDPGPSPDEHARVSLRHERRRSGMDHPTPTRPASTDTSMTLPRIVRHDPTRRWSNEAVSTLGSPSAASTDDAAGAVDEASRASKHPRLLSVTEPSPRASQKARLCSDDEYISLLNANAFDFSPLSSPSSPHATLLADPRRPMLDAEWCDGLAGDRGHPWRMKEPWHPTERTLLAASPRPHHIGPYAQPATPLQPQRQQPSHPPSLPSRLNLTSQAPELDTSPSASVTPVSPTTPPLLNAKPMPEPHYHHHHHSHTYTPHHTFPQQGASHSYGHKPTSLLALPAPSSTLSTASLATTTAKMTTGGLRALDPAALTDITDTLYRHGFPYVAAIQSLICLHCAKPRILYGGIVRSHLRKHVTELSHSPSAPRRGALPPPSPSPSPSSPHRPLLALGNISALTSELEHLTSFLPSFARTIEDVPRRPCGLPALPYLPIVQGFRCLVCDFCAVSSRYVDNHWGEKHKNTPGVEPRPGRGAPAGLRAGGAATGAAAPGGSRPAVLYKPAALQTLGGSRQLTRLFWVTTLTEGPTEGPTATATAKAADMKMDLEA
ncbi:MAG: hypothetical protein M1826_005887 [Phylliscum demangeonii]|nr:MAG: hypothetical protein M1826_005887 [Phylliscum demangeonii]